MGYSSKPTCRCIGRNRGVALFLSLSLCIFVIDRRLFPRTPPSLPPSLDPSLPPLPPSLPRSLPPPSLLPPPFPPYPFLSLEVEKIVTWRPCSLTYNVAAAENNKICTFVSKLDPELSVSFSLSLSLPVSLELSISLRSALNGRPSACLSPSLPVPPLPSPFLCSPYPPLPLSLPRRLQGQGQAASLRMYANLT
jgi:hypothetical protein